MGLQIQYKQFKHLTITLIMDLSGPWKMHVDFLLIAQKNYSTRILIDNVRTTYICMYSMSCTLFSCPYWPHCHLSLEQRDTYSQCRNYCHEMSCLFHAAVFFWTEIFSNEAYFVWYPKSITNDFYIQYVHTVASFVVIRLSIIIINESTENTLKS